MAYKDILVQLAADAASVRRAAYAARLAGAHGAHLTGVFLRPALPQANMDIAAGAWAPAVLFRDVIAAHNAKQDEACAATRLAFEAATKGLGPRAHGLTVETDLAHGLIDLARLMDLTIVPETPMPSQGDFHLSAAGLALASGGPVLILPTDLENPSGDRVLVAWKGTRESVRALRDAGPMLDHAKQVRGVIVSSDGEAEAVNLRRRLGAEVTVEATEDGRAAQILRRQAEEWNADLIVMGLYGRLRLSELILGGVSRDLLAHPPCALLVAH